MNPQDIIELMRSFTDEQKREVWKEHCPVVRIKIRDDILFYTYCPYCEYDRIYRKHKYCPNCGSRIEWDV